MRKHHKIILGGFGSIVLTFMIVSGILLNGIIVKQTINHNELNYKIESLQADTQSKLNELTNNVIKTKGDLNLLTNQIDTIDDQFEELKVSTGSDFSGIIEDAIKSVVTIRTDVGQGTGFIISEEGFMITNAHILSGGQQIESLNYEQERMETSFVGYDLDSDLALLKVNGNFKPLKLANSNEVQIGERVIAIGNPLGLQFSVSQGIVSAIHREGPNAIGKYIQTDTALNPGNSGGPLINTDGEVIGINNFKIGDSENLGFALESNYIKDSINEISQDELNISLID